MSKPLEYFSYQEGELHADGVPLSKIAQSLGTPTYVYSAEAFLSGLKQLQAGLSSMDALICFAVKSNSNLSILKLLADAGAGVDLVSGGELFRAKSAKIRAEKIVFSGVGKTPDEMKEALNYPFGPIFSFNVESVPELETLNQVAKSWDKIASIALRYNPNVNAKTHPYISTGLKRNKFGMNHEEIVKVLKNHSRYTNIRIRGISIHIGSQLTSLSPMEDAFRRASQMIREANSILSEPLQYVDLGGGLGITYDKEKVPSIQKYCQLVVKHFGPKSKQPMRVLIEPGRTISGNSGVLLSRVLYRKARTKKDFLILDAAMNDLMRPALYGSHHEITPLRQSVSQGKKHSFDVVGPVCESADCFASDRKLSDRLAAGDYVAILSAGAYGFSMSSTYNSRPRPAEVLVQNGSYQVIRERETIEDLIRGEKL